MSNNELKPLNWEANEDIGYTVTRRPVGGMHFVFSDVTHTTLEHWRAFALDHLLDSDRLTRNLYDLRQLDDLPDEAVHAGAAPVRIFKTQSADAFQRGEASGVAIETSGVLALAPSAERVAALEAPFAFAVVAHGDGWAVATGNDGEVVAVARDGGTRVLFDAGEPEIFALAADRDGALLVGSSPDDKVYRVGGDGASEVLFDPEETYVWALAGGADGALWVATGDPGRLYRIRPGATPEAVWDGGASHVRSLLALPDGDLLFGTAGDGRLLRWRDGAVRTLHDILPTGL